MSSSHNQASGRQKVKNGQLSLYQVSQPKTSNVYIGDKIASLNVIIRGTFSGQSTQVLFPSNLDSFFSSASIFSCACTINSKRVNMNSSTIKTSFSPSYRYHMSGNKTKLHHIRSKLDDVKMLRVKFGRCVEKLRII